MANLNPPVNEIFAAALKLDSPEARQAYLDHACRDDAELRSQVEALLQTPFSDAALPDLTIDSAARQVPTAPLPSRPSTAVGTIIAGRYKLLQLIGEGVWAPSGWRSSRNRSAASWPSR